MLSRALLRVSARPQSTSTAAFTSRIQALAQRPTVKLRTHDHVKAPTLSTWQRGVLGSLVGAPIALYLVDTAAGAEGSTRTWLDRHFVATREALDAGRWWTPLTTFLVHDNLVTLSINTVLTLVGGRHVLLRSRLCFFWIVLMSCGPSRRGEGINRKINEHWVKASINTGIALSTFALCVASRCRLTPPATSGWVRSGDSSGR